MNSVLIKSNLLKDLLVLRANAEKELAEINAKINNINYELLAEFESHAKKENILPAKEVTTLAVIQSTPKTFSDIIKTPKQYSTILYNSLPETSREQNIQITNDLSLPAIRVDSFGDVCRDGKMYYVEPANHFAMYISGELFNGNIGIIYNNEKMPVKIKNCKFNNKGQCSAGCRCTYYHDPLIFEKSKDVRNFAANSWVFANDKWSTKTQDDSLKYRRFGSITTLDNDTKNLSADEISRFKAMVFHDILCALVVTG